MRTQLTLLICVVASRAGAQPAGAQAEALFREGRSLMAEGKIAEACEAFDASERLDPAITTRLNQAACHEQAGQLATAWAQFLDVERQTRASTDPAGQQFHKTALDRAKQLEARVSTLTVVVPPATRVSGLEVRRGGELVDPGAWNHALPIDGGTYELRARAEGYVEAKVSVTVAAADDAKSIEIPPLAKAAAPTPTPVEPAAPVPEKLAVVRETPSHVPAFILGGSAIALAGAAVGFELWGDSTYDRAKTASMTPGTSQAAVDELWRSANDKRYIAEAAGIAAVGCAGAAIWLYLRTPSSHADEQAMRIQPSLGRGAAGFVVIGGF